MSVHDPQVLPPDVVISPVRRLSRRANSTLGAVRTGFIASRPGSRHPGHLLDGRAAALLRLFRKPRRVVEAILAYAGTTGEEPQQVLTAAFPMIRDCCNAGLLVDADSPEAARIEPMLRRGERVGRWRITRCVQALADVELYQAGDDRESVAIKIMRPGGGAMPGQLLANEAGALRVLAGRGAPRLVGRALHEGRPYLAMAWCGGTSPAVVAAELRETGRRDELLALCCAIVDAYARLHALGVVHGDVDSRNLLIGADGSVSILDFGLSRVLGDDGKRRVVPRAGVSLFTEPEYARAVLASRALPRASKASDQYAVGALLYSLLAGGVHLDFALRRQRALQQIASASPLPFARRQTRPWPAVEQLLRRALCARPVGRFGSMEAFAAALRGAGDTRPAAMAGGTRSPASRSGEPELDRVLRHVLGLVDLDGPSFVRDPAPPTASVTYGAAGLSAGLCRIACTRDDPWLLSLADVWLSKAEADLGRPEAYYSPDLGLTAEVVGTTSPYHTASGIHLVRALLSLARGDGASAGAATAAFASASRGRCRCLDLTLGRAGTLLGCALLLDALRADGRVPTAAVRALGAATLARLWSRLGTYPPISDCPPLPTFGMAHGWAGVLYATLRWCAAAGASMPDALERRLDELASCAEPVGRGVQWVSATVRSGGEHLGAQTSSWCNGSAGFVHLWTLAHRELGRPRLLDLAGQSAWHAWEDGESGSSLCCSLGGRAYGLLNLYRHTGDQVWLERARILGIRAAREALVGRPAMQRSLSLYKGSVGTAVLAADLERPEFAAMPVFEDEGWPKTATI